MGSCKNTRPVKLVVRAQGWRIAPEEKRLGDSTHNSLFASFQGPVHNSWCVPRQAFANACRLMLASTIGGRLGLPTKHLTARRCAGIRAPCRCRAEAASTGSKPGRPWRLAAKIVGTGVVAAGVLVASLPSIISTRLGLSASLAVINALAPGQVEVTTAQMGWTSPISVEGLKLKDKASRQAVPLVTVQRISSNAGLWQLLQAARLRPAPQASGGASASRTSSDASSISSISSDSSSVSSTAWPSCGPIVVQGASFNCEYDPASRKFKLIDWLEGAWLLSSGSVKQPSLPALPHLPGVGGQDTDTSPESGHAASNRGTSTAAAGRGDRSQPGKQPGISTSAGDGSSKSVKEHGRAVEMLCHADAYMRFSCDLKMGNGLQLLLPDAQLQVPQQVRNMLGYHLHLTGALGSSALNDWAQETEEDVSWARPDEDDTLLDAPARQSSGLRSFNRLSSDSEDAASLTGNTIYPPPSGYQPGVLQLHSQHLRAQMRLYTKERGSGPTLLPEPAAATLEFTPALSRFGLSMFNPLLSNAIAVQGPSHAVRMYFAPDGMQLPYTGAQILVQPMRLSVAGGGLFEDLCRAVRLNPEVARQKVLQLQMSGMQVHLASQGPITTNRVDMSIGLPSGDGNLLELSLWGYNNPDSGALDMVLGMPPSFLQQLGIGQLPEGYLLPVQLKGTVDRSEIGYDGLLRRLSKLLLRQQYLNARHHQERLRTEVQGRGNGGLVSKALGAVANLQLPDVKAVREAEEQVALDMKRIPQPWPLPVPAWVKQ